MSGCLARVRSHGVGDGDADGGAGAVDAWGWVGAWHAVVAGLVLYTLAWSSGASALDSVRWACSAGVWGVGSLSVLGLGGAGQV